MISELDEDDYSANLNVFFNSDTCSAFLLESLIANLAVVVQLNAEQNH